MKDRVTETHGKELTFDEAANKIFVVVRRGAAFIILGVKKVITSFIGGQQIRILILSDDSHYLENDFKGRCYEV